MKIRIRRKITINLYTMISVLSFIVLAYYFLPITASVLTAYMMLGILGLSYFIIFIYNDWTRKEIVFSNFLLICSAVILFLIREYYKDGLIGVYSILLVFFPAFLSICMLSKGHKKTLEKFAICALIMLGITAITTYIGLNVYPELARDLAAYSTDNIIGLSTKYNIGGYDIVYCVVLVIPMVCLLVEKKMPKLLKIIFKILTFLCSLVFIVKTQYTTGMLLAIVSCGMIIAIRKFDLKRLCILALLGLLVLNSFKSEISNVLSNASSTIESQSISQRLDEVSRALEGGKVTGEDMTARGNAYGKSLDAFEEHPVLGTWFASDNEALGGHSTILDLMAGAGIFAFLLVAYTVYYIIKLVGKKIQGDITKKYVGIFLLIYIVLAIVNPIISGAFFSVMFIILPGVALIEDKSLEDISR